jgi:hypothetical protein
MVRDESGRPEFLEQFTQPPPAHPFTMRVLEDRWDFDGDQPVRTIVRFELVDHG